MSNIRVFLIFTLIIVVYFLGAFVDIMDVDSGQYASMAREMIDSGNWLHFTDREVPYLDKPPFIFWITGLSYKLFGISNFTFKLPSILFSLLGIYSTFRFTKLYYSREAAIYSALVLASTQAYFHFNNDVRTDAYLTNAVIFSMWQLATYIKTNRKLNFILAFAGFGIAMLAKGPLGLMVPALGFGSYWLLTKQYKSIFNPRWLLGIVITFLVLSPMLWGLYTQFDLQPSQVVNEKTGVSGLRFFFWEQSFGRITGENVWKNDTGPFFFVHNLLWSFLPWTIVLIFAFYHHIRKLLLSWKQNIQIDEAAVICLFGGVLTFLALSASAYKLPHYIYVVFPLFAILTGTYLEDLFKSQHIKQLSFLKGFAFFFLIVVLILMTLLYFWVFQPEFFLRIVIPFLLLLLGFYFFFKETSIFNKTIISLTMSVIAFNWTMNTHFYPELLNYQAPGNIARLILKENIPVGDVYNYGVGGRALDVYTETVIRDITTEDLLKKDNNVYLHTDEKGLENLKSNEIQFEIIEAFDNIAVTRLSLKFINPKTRKEATEKRYLVKLVN
jgi:4-amino-4-deoxy-L-arabinose transferase-like glycosyltransferase